MKKKIRKILKMLDELHYDVLTTNDINDKTMILEKIHLLEVELENMFLCED